MDARACLRAVRAGRVVVASKRGMSHIGVTVRQDYYSTADGRVHEQCGPEAGALGRLAAVLLAEREHHQIMGVQRLKVAHCMGKRGDRRNGQRMVRGGGQGRARASERGPGIVWPYAFASARASERGPGVVWPYAFASARPSSARAGPAGSEALSKLQERRGGGVNEIRDSANAAHWGVGGVDSLILPMFSEAESRCSAPLVTL